MGLFSRFKSKPKLYDKTLVLFIPIFSDINPEFARMVDNGGRAKASEVAMNEDLLAMIIRNHFYEEFRPPVKWNVHYNVVVYPNMTSDQKRELQFWNDNNGQIKDRGRYSQMCSDLRTVAKEQMLKAFPDYDRDRFEDGFENICFDYDAEKGMIICSFVLKQFMPVTD